MQVLREGRVVEQRSLQVSASELLGAPDLSLRRQVARESAMAGGEVSMR